MENIEVLAKSFLKESCCPDHACADVEMVIVEWKALRELTKNERGALEVGRKGLRLPLVANADLAPVIEAQLIALEAVKVKIKELGKSFEGAKEALSGILGQVKEELLGRDGEKEEELKAMARKIFGGKVELEEEEKSTDDGKVAEATDREDK